MKNLIPNSIAATTANCHKYGKLWAVIGVIGCAVIAMPSQADCARIAYSRTTGYSGYGYESGSCSSSSSDRAISECGRSDCVVELTMQGECGSLARSSDNYGYVTSGKGSTRSSAGNKALANCGSGCRLITTTCAD